VTAGRRLIVVLVPLLAFVVGCTMLVWWLGDRAEWTIVAASAIGTGSSLVALLLLGEWVVAGSRKP
jgi:hypothetical protein